MFSTARGRIAGERKTVCLGRLVGEIERKKERKRKIYPYEVIIIFPPLHMLKVKHSGGKNKKGNEKRKEKYCNL